MLVVFSLLEDIDISYKTVERLYSDEEVALAIHNLLIFEEEGSKRIRWNWIFTNHKEELRIFMRRRIRLRKRKEMMMIMIVTAVTMSTNQPFTGEGYSYTHSR